jgi:putative DNA primase/helicase
MKWGRRDAREVGDTVYMLANESGKQRAGRTGAARQRYSWRVPFLSTGELTLAQKMNEAGKQAKAGLEVRLVNLPADARAGLGVFQNLHGRQGGPAAFADELRTAALAHHGHAARAFLRLLTQNLADDPTGLRATLNELRSEFMLQHVPAGATGQVRSVAGRFALVAAAGELAREYGILPWSECEALHAVGRCFDDWLAARGGTGASEEQQAITQVQAFIEAHGTSRFEWVGPGAPEEGTSRIINRVGFRRRADDGVWEYHVLPEAWRNEVCKGLNPRRVAELLALAGYLTTGNEDGKCRYDVKRRIYGENSMRTYLLRGTILGSGEA